MANFEFFKQTVLIIVQKLIALFKHKTSSDLSMKTISSRRV